MFHIFSPPFLPFCSEFSKCQKLKLFPSRVDGCLQAHWEGQDFYSNEFFLCKNTWISCTASASTDPRLWLWHTNAFILRGYKGNYMMPSVFFELPGKKCHSNPKETHLVRLFLYIVTQLENKPLTSSKNTVPADPTPAVDSNLFLKDDRYWKLRQKFTTSITT